MNEAIRALQQVVSTIFRLGEHILNWVITQIGRYPQINWAGQPWWKIAVLVVAAGAAGYCFYQVYKPIWGAFRQLLQAFGGFIAALISAIPWIALGGLAIALGLMITRL